MPQAWQQQKEDFVSESFTASNGGAKPGDVWVLTVDGAEYAWFERLVAGYLAAVLNDDRIDRRVKRGTKDRGDIGGVRTPLGDRVVIEVKSTSRIELSGWVREAEVERDNDDAHVGVVVHKRVGKSAAQMGEQFVTMTLSDFAVLLGADRNPYRPDAISEVVNRLENE